MPRKARQKSARPIATRRDFEGASAAAKRLSEESERDTAAELRLQSLLKELDRFDGDEDDGLDSPDADYDSTMPRRRWSDDE